jgi:hypothetical protein
MLSLHDTQIAFGAAIHGEDAGALGELIGDDGISPERRIQIYRNNYRLNTLTALQATYPVVERLGGAEWFAQSAAKYQDSRPSQSGDLQYFSAAYPGFLRQDLENTEFGYFADVAALEWAYESCTKSRLRITKIWCSCRSRPWGWWHPRSRFSRSGMRISLTARTTRRYGSMPAAAACS